MTTITPQPAPDLLTLERLVGTWQVSGEAVGSVRYEWLPGGFFLLQHIDLEQEGQRHQGLEVIGHLQPFGEATSPDIHSRYYGDAGETLDYVYELTGDTLTIWAGQRDSPARYQGEFSADGQTCAGRWEYPGGSGYSSTMIRRTER